MAAVHVLQYCEYDKVAIGYGGTGFQLDRSNEARLDEMLSKAQSDAGTRGTSVLVNCLIGRTSFREGSLSV